METAPGGFFFFPLHDVSLLLKGLKCTYKDHIWLLSHFEKYIVLYNKMLNWGKNFYPFWDKKNFVFWPLMNRLKRCRKESFRVIVDYAEPASRTVVVDYAETASRTLVVDYAETASHTVVVDYAETASRTVVFDYAETASRTLVVDYAETASRTVVVDYAETASRTLLEIVEFVDSAITVSAYIL